MASTAIPATFQASVAYSSAKPRRSRALRPWSSRAAMAAVCQRHWLPAGHVTFCARTRQYREADELMAWHRLGRGIGHDRPGGRSLSVLAVGLDGLADVTGSATLIWRFRAERRPPGRSQAAEARAAIVVAAALATVSTVITIQAAIALAASSRPGTSGLTLIAAGVPLVVLMPLVYANRRLGARMAGRARQADGTLGGIGAATSLLALTALTLYPTLGWWWAGRATALIVAAIAAIEAWRTAQHP
jgi:hypothetical protein